MITYFMMDHNQQSDHRQYRGKIAETIRFFGFFGTIY